MMPHTFHRGTANELWHEIAQHLSNDDECEVLEGRGGRTVELLHVGLSLQNPRERWIPSRQPPLNIAFALAEVIWILSGRRDAAFLHYWNSKLPDYVGTAALLHGAYGYRLRRHFGVDQLERAASVLRNNPNTRQVVLQIWDPTADLPMPDGSPTDADIPCNIMSLLKVRQGRLEWMQIVRSNDIFLGVPYNIVQFTFLQEVLAGWIGVELGTYTQVSDSLHVYEHDLNFLRDSSLIDAAVSTDRYDLLKPAWDAVIAEMVAHTERFIANDLTLSELTSRVSGAKASEGYLNMLRILAAESARRRKWTEATREFSALCTNPALRQMWDRWLSTRPQQGHP